MTTPPKAGKSGKKASQSLQKAAQSLALREGRTGNGEDERAGNNESHGGTPKDRNVGRGRGRWRIRREQATEWRRGAHHGCVARRMAHAAGNQWRDVLCGFGSQSWFVRLTSGNQPSGSISTRVTAGIRATRTSCVRAAPSQMLTGR